MPHWRGKRVFITGVCGTVGQELLRQVVSHGPDEVIGIDNNESELFFVSEHYSANPAVKLYLGDLRDRECLQRQLEGMDVVLHTAALKHVVLCEQSPRDAVQTNILGTQNLVDAALANGVQRVLFTSSDKAVNPTSVMGTSKLMGERLMTAAHALRRNGGPIFASTRFGNVLGSRGSVLPLFRRQIEAGGPVTLTHPDMSRFIMTLKEAVHLVMESVFMARGGEVFVTKMPVVRIADVARVMVEELAAAYGHRPEDVQVVNVGTKPGEKLYEELMNEEEVRRTVELTRYFVVTPAFQAVYQNIDYTYEGAVPTPVVEAYNSANAAPMSRETLRRYLYEHGLLEGGKGPMVPALKLMDAGGTPAETHAMEV
jgi:FlaA1/EpsC-like NDP-sugar epimerase